MKKSIILTLTFIDVRKVSIVVWGRGDTMSDKLSVLDLFAGAGGLSLGFEQTEKFEIKAAVEINEFAKQTYALNKSSVKLYDDITTLDYDSIKREFGRIDVVIGGPPCQGFSNANRQKNHLVSGNNSLVKHFIKAIQELEPKAFVMENVKTMKSKSHKFFLENGERDEIYDLGLKLSEEEILLGDIDEFTLEVFDVCRQHEDVSPFLLDEKVFSKLNTLFRVRRNVPKCDAYLLKQKNFFKAVSTNSLEHHLQELAEEYPGLWYRMVSRLNICLRNGKVDAALLGDVEIVLEVQKMLSKVVELHRHNLEFELFIRGTGIFVKLTSYNVFDFVLNKLKKLGYFSEPQVLKAVQFGVPQQRERLFIVGVKQEYRVSEKAKLLPKGFLSSNEYYTISDAFSDLEDLEPNLDVSDAVIHKGEEVYKRNESNALYDYYHDTDVLHNHIMTDTRDIAKKRYEALKPGQSFRDLSDEFKTTYSDPSRTQKTIYHRLDYEFPSRTVVNVRKSMWIHPSKPRAVSVREAARLQSFPDSYVFCGTKDAQYQQVGNAVPPLLGRAVAEQLLRVMGLNVEKPLIDLLSRPLFSMV